MKGFENVSYLDDIRDRIDSDISRGHGVHILSSNYIAEKLSRAVGNGTEFVVNYIDMKDDKTSFIMACYPDLDELDTKLSDLIKSLGDDAKPHEIYQVWNNIKKWNIEIDDRVLTTGTHITVDNGSEFVAVLCHEIGHVMNTFPGVLRHNYRVDKATAGLVHKALMTKPGKIIASLCLPMFVCVNGLRIVVKSPSRQINEIRADMMVPDEYKPYLVSYAENHILKYPMANNSVKTNTEYDNEIKQGVEFSKGCVSLMSKRVAVLKHHISVFGKINSSPYVRKVGEYLDNNVTPDNIIKKNAVQEMFNRELSNAQSQANVVMETTNVSDRDLLLLQCDIDSIKTMDDKIYVLNTIFDYLEICEKQKQKAIKKYKNPLDIPDKVVNDPRIKTLQQMKTQVTELKIDDRDGVYSLYVKYPKGYEG